VLALVGYAAGLAADERGRSLPWSVLVVAGSAATAVVVYALQGLLLGDARVTGPAFWAALGSSVTYAALLATLVVPVLRASLAAPTTTTCGADAGAGRGVRMTERSTVRLFVLRVLVVALLATLFGRLWFLQVYAADEYVRAAGENRVREVVETAPRGEVVDARGTPLVGNATTLVVSVDRAVLLRQPDDGAAVLARLGEVLGRPAELLAQEVRPCGGGVQQPCWRGSPYRPVPVATFDAGDPAGLAKVLAVEERREDFPGVRAEFAAVRRYPQGTLAAHVLGYLGPISPEEVDDPGLRRRAARRPDRPGRRRGDYDRALRGEDGVTRLQVDHVGAVTGELGGAPPVPGSALVLSIDAGVQRVAEQALARAVARARTMPARGSGLPLVADSGSVVVMEARTGRVLAMASYPSYDPQVFLGGVSTEQYAALVDESRGAPLVFRAIQGAYAPASTFKPISLAAAVQSGDYPLRAQYACPGVYAPTGQTNFDAAPLGVVDLREALVKSCDTVFYAFGYEQWQRDGGARPVAEPADPMIRMAQAFGLGTPTGVDLPSERRGTIADRAYKQRYWEQHRENRCAGADNPALPPERRTANREFCTDGNLLRGGDATNFAIGQGDTLVTPLQLATVYAAIANGGTLVEPHVGRALLARTARSPRSPGRARDGAGVGRGARLRP
jgi:penicillin-binding protein 2